MHIVLDLFSALEYWLSDRAPSNPSFLVGNPALTSFEYCPCKELTRMLARAGGRKDTLHLLVSDKSERRQSEYVTCRAWGPKPLPSQSICEIGDGIYVISPELCVVRLAVYVSRLELLRHATDLMGTFARSHASRTDLVERQPVMTKASLQRYLDGAGNIPGARKVRQIISWLREGVASPRETSMILMLSMPSQAGGMGLPEFQPNVEMPLSKGAKLLTQKSYLVGDALFGDIKDHGPVLEYNSNTKHDTEEQLEFDFEKITAMQRMGRTVIPVSTRQFNEYDSFKEIVTRVRQLTGKREKLSRGRKGIVDARRSFTHAKLLELERAQRERPSMDDLASWTVLVPRLFDWSIF